MLKKFLVIDLVVQIVIIIITVLILLFPPYEQPIFEEVNKNNRLAFIIFYFGLGSIQFIGNLIKVYYFKITERLRMFYHKLLKFVLLMFMINLFCYFLSKYEIIPDLIAVSFYLAFSMLIIGVMMAVINIAASYEELKKVEYDTTC